MAPVVEVGHLLIGLALVPTTIAGRSLQQLRVMSPRVRGAMGMTPGIQDD